MSDLAIDSFLALTKALSDPTRIRIVGVLFERECCACELVNMLGLAQATVSRHLSILVQSGLVLGRKDGRWMHYRLPGKQEPAVTPLQARFLVLLQNHLADSFTIKNDCSSLRGCQSRIKQTCCS